MKLARQLLGAWIAICLLASGAVAACPQKAIKLIVPYPPGVAAASALQMLPTGNIFHG